MAALVVALCPLAAEAGGFYMTDRGVRPLGRGGAFIAGADDLHSVWYNPAGLARAERGLLLDASLVNFNNSYTREIYTDPSAREPVRFRAVEGQGETLPIPTLVLAHNFGLRNAMFAAGVMAPYAAITSYDQSPDAPQRYSLLTLDGSLLAIAGVWAAWRPHPMIAFGGGVSMLVGSFASRLTFSGCPATITCAPENPDWDAVAQLTVGPIISPTGSLGVQFFPHRAVTVGVSGQLPLWVDAPATLGVRLPGAAFYDGASVRGDQANVSFRLAPVIRAGIEIRPIQRVRVELAGVWEGWSVHDRIDLVPQGIRIENARGVGTYDVGPVALTRNFQDTFSVRLGTEAEVPLSQRVTLMHRVGMAYETSATAPENTSVLTMDAEKFVGSLGASLAVGRWRIDAVFAYMFASSVAVDPRDAALYPTAPFRSSPQAPRFPINGGNYVLNVNVVGLGAHYRW